MALASEQTADLAAQGTAADLAAATVTRKETTVLAAAALTAVDTTVALAGEETAKLAARGTAADLAAADTAVALAGDSKRQQI